MDDKNDDKKLLLEHFIDYCLVPTCWFCHI